MRSCNVNRETILSTFGPALSGTTADPVLVAATATGVGPNAFSAKGEPCDDEAMEDPEPRQRGVRALRVFDTAAVPSRIGGIPAAPAMMIAEAGAGVIPGRFTP